MNNILIGIHGLSNKPPVKDLACGWKQAITEGLEKNEDINNPNINFSSVYWADVLYDQPDENPEIYQPAEPDMLKAYKEGWVDSARTRILSLFGNILDSSKEKFGINSMADKFIERKLQDLYRYYEDEEIRGKLQNRLKKEILEHKDKRIMILAHSMGTIIAYDVLRKLGKEDPKLVVDHFITLGSPLGLPHIKNKMVQSTLSAMTPSVVKKWSNFADKRDPVAMDVRLSDDYKPNSDGIKVEDKLIANDWGGGGIPHHKSYGYLRAPEVSKVIKDFL